MQGTASAAEQAELAELVDQYSNAELEEVLEPLAASYTADPNFNISEWEKEIQNILNDKQAPVRTIWFRSSRTIKRLAIAASIILVIGTGLWLMLRKESGLPTPNPGLVAHDVEPPKNTRATITLADGRVINLDSVNAGTVAKESNVAVTKTTDGKIVYNDSRLNTPNLRLIYNTLTNPRGSKVIDITLSDGSHVWLNAGSSITYPVTFSGNERKVQMTGEAYFEISASPNPSKGGALRSFIVEKRDMQVEVLGTHFNVNAYDDEPNIKVTLLEGKVNVIAGGAKKTIIPGEQAVVASGSRPDSYQVRTLNSIDPDEVLAWKNNKFKFNSADIKTIGRQLEKWYDVEFVYESEVPDHFTGIISRDVTASDVFKMLKNTGTMNVRIEGKKVFVSR
ncbi:MAG TPA: FecR domain-containing protein [Chitinophagaceae bacterium]|nr:FecR domain-containing protein [Chitinophagaceae bacterium]